jgi:4-hydroxy-3-methylbut-2-enyl diphosphate reductase
MVVIGGYNSSNTQALARMCAAELPTFHIDAAGCLERDSVRHKRVGGMTESHTHGWLAQGPACIGITAGASTPDSVVGDVIDRILRVRGESAELLHATQIHDGSITGFLHRIRT